MNELTYQFRYALPLWLVMLLCSWLPENRITQRLRGRLIECVVDSQGGLRVAGRVQLVNVRKLRLGRNVYIGPGAWVNALGGLTLGDDVMLGPYVCIATTEHGFKDGVVRGGGTHTAPVAIDRGSWLAAHAVVTSGTRVGAGCIVGANSVVTRDLPDNSVAVGVPARRVAERVDHAGAISRRSDA